MRTTRAGLGALLSGVLLLSGACSLGSGEAPVRIAADPEAPSSSPPSSPGSGGGSGGSGGSGATPTGDARTCAQVVAGINAFNTGDYVGSVRDFEVAVPLARAALESSPSAAARDLLAAVRYYAQIDPDAYQAALGTPSFTKYQVITLSQCEPPDSGGAGSGGGGIAI